MINMYENVKPKSFWADEEMDTTIMRNIIIKFPVGVINFLIQNVYPLFYQNLRGYINMEKQNNGSFTEVVKVMYMVGFLSITDCTLDEKTSKLELINVGFANMETRSTILRQFANELPCLKG